MTSKVPAHVAIIMDGNGRWAQMRGYARIRGHREGAKRVDEIVTECTRLGVKYLTLYTFSTENWERPKAEVNMLMRLLVQNLKIMDKKLLKNGVKLVAQGTLDRLPHFVRIEIERVARMTDVPDHKMVLSLALSYGGRQEIVDAAKKWAEEVVAGKTEISALTEDSFKGYLYHPDFPDPDLMIRTGGDSRISNFLLWGVAYSEFLVVPDHWPDFRPNCLAAAFEVYSKRQRRFGKTSEQVSGRSGISLPAFMNPL